MAPAIALISSIIGFVSAMWSNLNRPWHSALEDWPCRGAYRSPQANRRASESTDEANDGHPGSLPRLLGLPLHEPVVPQGDSGLDQLRGPLQPGSGRVGADVISGQGGVRP